LINVPDLLWGKPEAQISKCYKPNTFIDVGKNKTLATTSKLIKGNRYEAYVKSTGWHFLYQRKETG